MNSRDTRDHTTSIVDRDRHVTVAVAFSAEEGASQLISTIPSTPHLDENSLIFYKVITE